VRIQLRLKGHEKIGRLAARFRAEADGGLRRDLGAEIERDAPAVLAKIRARVMRSQFPAEQPSPTYRPRTTRLRERLAAATTTQTLTSPVGVRFTVDGSVVNPADPRAGHALARYTDVELARRWRHQTFGRTGPDDWFIQLGDPWLGVSVRPEEIRFRRGVEKAIERTARRIER
jgi:hypothetical protein